MADILAHRVAIPHRSATARAASRRVATPQQAAARARLGKTNSDPQDVARQARNRAAAWVGTWCRGQYCAAVALEVATITSIAGAVGLGTVIGQWFAGAKDRRAAKAAVLQAIVDVEQARWAGDQNPDGGKMREATRSLHTAALIAKLPRKPVRHYLVLASAAHYLSQHDYEISGDPEHGGGIDAEFSDIVRDSARVIVARIWGSALWGKLTDWWRLRGLRKRLDQAVAGNRDIAQRVERAKNNVSA